MDNYNGQKQIDNNLNVIDDMASGEGDIKSKDIYVVIKWFDFDSNRWAEDFYNKYKSTAKSLFEMMMQDNEDGD